MDVPLAVVADAANVSREGKLNILGLFDTIRAEAFPCVHPMLALVIRFQGDPGDRGQRKELRIQFVDEDGQLLISLDSVLAVAADAGLRPTFDNILAIGGLQLPRPGGYEFLVLVNGQTQARVPLRAELIQTGA